MSITKNIIYALTTAIGLMTAASCIDEEPYVNTPEGNFEALWKLIDERYCFFEYKEKKLGIDWDSIHDEYKRRITPKMDNYQLFEVCCDMLSELKDGHVNLSAAFDIGREWSYYEPYPENFDQQIQQNYLGTDYKIASGLKYKILDDNIGYVYCESFNDAIGDGNLSYMLDALSTCTGLIVDIRNNGGGRISTAHQLASRFTNEKKLIGYMSHKTGKGHYDLSDPEPVYLEPSDGIRWQKNTVVLTNRRCFSAANDFVKCIKTCPNVTILGDYTGGGSGMPFTQEIPCGWSVRYSAVIIYDKDMNHTEFGIEPDIKAGMEEEDMRNGKDTIIEKAREFLKEQASKNNCQDTSVVKRQSKTNCNI